MATSFVPGEQLVVMTAGLSLIRGAFVAEDDQFFELERSDGLHVRINKIPILVIVEASPAGLQMLRRLGSGDLLDVDRL